MKKLISALAAVVLAAGGTGVTGVLAEEAAQSIVYGDADCDGLVKMNDVVLIMQCISNPDKYSLSAPGKSNADVHERYGGITPLDALAIQNYLLEQGSLPSGYAELTVEKMENAFAAYLCSWLSFYMELNGKSAVPVITAGDAYGRIRASQLVEGNESSGSDREKMTAAVADAFEGGFYEEYDLFTEIKGRPFLTETDINAGEPEIKELDFDELARSSAQNIIGNESLWGVFGSDIVSAIGAGAKISEDGRIYFVVFIAGKNQ